MTGVIARPGGPVSLLDLEPRTFVAFLEGVLREAPHQAQALDELYAASRPKPPTPPRQSRAERNAEIARVTRMFSR